MSVSRTITLLAVLLCGLLAFQPRAMAQDKVAGLKIAVLDDQKLLGASLAAKSIDSQLTLKRDSIKKELSGLEEKLAGEKKKIDTEKDKMKQDEFNKAVAAYQNDYLEARKLADSRRQELEQAANGALVEMRKAITKIVTDLAQKSGYNIVLTRQNVVLADAGMDITDAVLQELDKTLKTVPVKFGEPAKGQPKKH